MAFMLILVVLQERREMYEMSRASEISTNVWLGPTPDSTLMGATGECDPKVPDFDILVEASDLARPPDAKILRRVARRSATRPQPIEFPASGSMLPPTWSHAEVDALLDMCRWIHRLANAGPTPDTSEDDEDDDASTAPDDEAELLHAAQQRASSLEPDADGDIPMQNLPNATAATAVTPLPRPRKILIHCSDGYTESSLLAVAYFMFAEGLTVPEAWVRLHRDRGRNFFAYASDVALLRAIQPRLLQESPRFSALGDGGAGSSGGDWPSMNRLSLRNLGCGSNPAWLKRMDGSLPSRVLPYMYLGNLGHANNPGLLQELGITRVLSVGEAVGWPRDRAEAWGRENVLFIDRVQDNGVDGLTEEFERCLAFIERGRRAGQATLVHCRVGVSRSATICIAEVMRETGLSFPQA